MNGIQDFIERFLTPIDDPSSRLFYVNILVSLGFIVFYILIKVAFNFKDFFREIKSLVFQKKYWWNHSTRFDYKIYIINGLLKAFFFIPFVDCSFVISKWVVTQGSFVFKNIPRFSETPLNLFLFTVFAFIIDDLLRFLNHLMFHKIPFLWKFHAIHHSAKVITPMTLYRTHPFELLFSALRNSISLGTSIGLYIVLFEGPYNVFNIMGVNLFAFTFNMLASHLRHSHIPLSFGWLEYIFISPKQHQIHHSIDPQHYEKNFGVSLSSWDYLFGSRMFSWQVSKKISYGVRGLYKHSVVWLLKSPLEK